MAEYKRKEKRIYKPKVLIVEDMPTNVKAQIAEVKRHYTADNVVLLETAVKYLKEKQYKYIVLDVTLPTTILSVKDGNNAGYTFYDEYVSELAPNAKIIFWDRRTDKYFDTEKYGDTNKFKFLHKVKDRYSLRYALDEFKSVDNETME